MYEMLGRVIITAETVKLFDKELGKVLFGMRDKGIDRKTKRETWEASERFTESVLLSVDSGHALSDWRLRRSWNDLWTFWENADRHLRSIEYHVLYASRDGPMADMLFRRALKEVLKDQTLDDVVHAVTGSHVLPTQIYVYFRFDEGQKLPEYSSCSKQLTFYFPTDLLDKHGSPRSPNPFGGPLWDGLAEIRRQGPLAYGLL
ncbi:uncharacterized protein EV422DRAFT_502966 [Fimicolochytrium jonesii]|uniref:uncharacterized protein n=1 Tax=Fimicolochytrium jonesii TaxID=1396493 RepID=UPI0022FE0166|nr:uncharacterized protein EV422DRAFT_502966 [Fimicolochytrium jonesii]KAI8827294.1 hypothetical protein EV422DRAFT_502966 [Fimicolochytrium jonesii]